MVAESIRRNQEMADMSHTDADSDAGLPDDTDDLDDPLEVRTTPPSLHSSLSRSMIEKHITMDCGAVPGNTWNTRARSHQS